MAEEPEIRIKVPISVPLLWSQTLFFSLTLLCLDGGTKERRNSANSRFLPFKFVESKLIMSFSCVLASLTIHRLVAALGKGLNESAKIKTER